MADRIDERSNAISQVAYLKLSKELIENERAIHKVTADLAQLRGIKAGILKRAENDGADKDAMQFLLKLLKKHPDDDDRNRLLENAYKYAAWTDIPMWAAPTDAKPQGSLLVDPEDVQAAKAEFREESAKQNGVMAGLDGASKSLNPHDPVNASGEYVAWDAGWKIGDTDRFERAKTAPVKPAKKASDAPKPGRVKKNAEPAAAPKPRGRPRKAVINPAAPDAEEVAPADGDAPPSFH